MKQGVIIGAGIGGLTTALALKKQGFKGIFHIVVKELYTSFNFL